MIGDSASGTVHGTWIDVKSLFGGSNRAGILSEAECDEDALKKAYNDTLTKGVLRATVNGQAQEIYAERNQIKVARDVPEV